MSVSKYEWFVPMESWKHLYYRELLFIVFVYEIHSRYIIWYTLES